MCRLSYVDPSTWKTYLVEPDQFFLVLSTAFGVRMEVIIHPFQLMFKSPINKDAGETLLFSRKCGLADHHK